MTLRLPGVKLPGRKGLAWIGGMGGLLVIGVLEAPAALLLAAVPVIEVYLRDEPDTRVAVRTTARRSPTARGTGSGTPARRRATAAAAAPARRRTTAASATPARRTRGATVTGAARTGTTTGAARTGTRTGTTTRRRRTAG